MAVTKPYSGNAVKWFFNRLYHGEDDILVFVFFHADEIEIGGKSPLICEKYFPQAGATFRPAWP